MPEQVIEIPDGEQERFVWISEDGSRAIRPIRIANGNWILPARIIQLLRGRDDFYQPDLDDLEALSQRSLDKAEVRQAPRDGRNPGTVIRGRRR